MDTLKKAITREDLDGVQEVIAKRSPTNQGYPSPPHTNGTTTHHNNPSDLTNKKNTCKQYPSSSAPGRLETDGLYVSVKDHVGRTSSHPKNTPPRFEAFMMTGDLILNLNAKTSGYASNILGGGGSLPSKSKRHEKNHVHATSTPASPEENDLRTKGKGTKRELPNAHGIGSPVADKKPAFGYVRTSKSEDHLHPKDSLTTVNIDIDDDDVAASLNTLLDTRPDSANSANDRIVWTYNAPVAPGASSSTSSTDGSQSPSPQLSPTSVPSPLRSPTSPSPASRRRHTAPGSPKRRAPPPMPVFPPKVPHSSPMTARRDVKYVKDEQMNGEIVLVSPTSSDEMERLGDLSSELSSPYEERSTQLDSLRDEEWLARLQNRDPFTMSDDDTSVCPVAPGHAACTPEFDSPCLSPVREVVGQRAAGGGRAAGSSPKKRTPLEPIQQEVMLDFGGANYNRRKSEAKSPESTLSTGSGDLSLTETKSCVDAPSLPDEDGSLQGTSPPPLDDDSDIESIHSFHYSPKAVDMPSASRLAKRLFYLEGFKKSDVSRHLCKNNEFSRVVAEDYLKYFDFTNDTLDIALRKFLKQFSLAGETQERERVLVHFSKRFLDCNPGAFNSQDAVHTLTCALMLLNSDLHGQNIGRKMTCAEFIENLSDLNDGENFPKDILKSLFQSIKVQHLEWAIDDEDDEVAPSYDARRGPENHRSGIGFMLDVPDASSATEYKKGYVMRKCCVETSGKKTPFGKRGWKMFYATLKDLVIYLHKDEHGFRKNQLYDSLHNAIRIHHSIATKATDYTKKQHVFRLQTADMAEYLFQTSDSKELQSWIDTINFVTASLSAPPMAGAVGSQKKFQRPLLPCSHTKLNLQEQLSDHEERVTHLERELEEHRTVGPEKGSRSRVMHDFHEKENHLQHELKRYKTYAYLLRSKMGQRPDLEPPLVETSIGEVDEKETENGEKETQQSPAAAPSPTSTPERSASSLRGLTDRYSYRAAIYSGGRGDDYLKKSKKMNTKPEKKQSELTSDKWVEEKKPMKTEEICPESNELHENMFIYNKIEGEIVAIVNSNSHTFSSLLSSSERRIVHETAEKMNLNHTSVGENNERCIVISKITKRVEKPIKIKTEKVDPIGETIITKNDVDESTDENDLVVKLEDKEDELITPVEFICTLCSRIVPKENYNLHMLHCERIAENTCNNSNKSNENKEKVSLDQQNRTNGATEKRNKQNADGTHCKTTSRNQGKSIIQQANTKTRSEEEKNNEKTRHRSRSRSRSRSSKGRRTRSKSRTPDRRGKRTRSREHSRSPLINGRKHISRGESLKFFLVANIRLEANLRIRIHRRGVVLVKGGPQKIEGNFRVTVITRAEDIPTKLTNCRNVQQSTPPTKLFMPAKNKIICSTSTKTEATTSRTSAATNGTTISLDGNFQHQISNMAAPNMEEFVAKHLELLNLEREEEITENSKQYQDVSIKQLERRGICILKLRISSRFTGFYGRSIFSFEPFWPGKSLPAHKITNGDIVGVNYYQKGNTDLSKPLASGVVIKNDKNFINVAFDQSFDQLDLDDGVQYQLLKLTNEVSYRRIKHALKDLRKYNSSTANHLIDVLFNNSAPSDPLNVINDNVIFFNENLDSSQKEAVKFALNQKEIAIVHGPPGTGKTTTVIEIILQSNKLGQKILACAPSNVAVDNLVERLADYNVNMIRIGHPARFISKVQPFALDAVLSNSSYGQIIKDVRQEIDLLRKSTGNDRKRAIREAGFLYKELRTRETKATKELLERTSVVLATLTSAYVDGPLKHLLMEHFDLVVIDECSQLHVGYLYYGLQNAYWLAITCNYHRLSSQKSKAAKEGLALSLMERQISIHGNKIVRMLTTQYRMHELIMQWSSKNLYEDKLTAHSSVRTHLLKDLPEVNENEDTSTPILFIDTAGCNIFELDLVDEASKGNEGEADIAAAHVRNLISQGVKSTDIAVVTPYNLQTELLRLRLSSEFPGVEIRSVDGFQGREKEAIVMTLVRSNEKGDVGFLAEIRRLNVAVTRARRHLAIICDSETVSRHPKLKTLVEFLSEHAEIRSAHQYEDEDGKDEYETEKKKSELTSDKRVDKEKKVMKIEEICPKSNELREVLIYNKIEGEIVAFVNNVNANSHTFSSTLSSYERRIVHEIAEKMNLNHTSVGENNERCIVISKITKKVQKPKKIKKKKFDRIGETIITKNDVDESTDEDDLDGKLVDEEDELMTPVEFTCTLCLRIVPKQNYDMHMLHCGRIAEKTCNKSKKSNENKEKGPRKDDLKVKSTSTDDDFDTLLRDFVNADRKCNFPKCKVLTVTLGMCCDFCRRRFCYSHGLPEVHGCGEEARKQARKSVLKEGNAGSAIGVSNKKMNPVKRAHLERRLDKKLSELSNGRKSKSKE
uniref:PH and SEC7 domain-containing protein 4 n=1 Tax=Strigamia maritima TaxID=126957 RepID=T1J301_STRMM